MKLNLDRIEKHPLLSDKTVYNLKQHRDFLLKEVAGMRRRIERIENILSR